MRRSSFVVLRLPARCGHVTDSKLSSLGETLVRAFSILQRLTFAPLHFRHLASSPPPPPRSSASPLIVCFLCLDSFIFLSAMDNSAAVHDSAAAHISPPSHHDPPAYHPLDPHQPPQYHPNPHPPHPHPDPPHHSPPNELPPSYEDATGSPSAPLLAGPVSNYGTWQDSDETSTASTEYQSNETGLPEWFGSLVIIFFFAAIMFCLWKLTEPSHDDYCDFPGHRPCQFG